MTLFSISLPIQTASGVVYGAFDLKFPQPHEVTHTPPQLLGTSGDGTPELGAWGTMQWTYKTLPSDQWYYLQNLYRQTRQASSPVWGLVLLQWPDPSQNNTLVTATATWEPTKQEIRAPRVTTGLQLMFTHLGYQTNSVTHQGAYYIPPYFF